MHIPVLLAGIIARHNDGYVGVRAWCPLCTQYHYHGMSPREQAEERAHRIAHCHDKAPDGESYVSGRPKFKDYYLKLKRTKKR